MRWLALLGLVASAACSDVSTELVGPARSASGPPGDAADGAGDAQAPSADAASADSGHDSGPHVPALCGGKPCACDDGQDQDGDALVDGFDPECTGAYDDDESSFATGLPGGSTDTCRDCFWDANAGRGDDSCGYPSACLFGEAPTVAGGCFSCEVGATCLDRCLALTPNGCDCFGCCEITRADGSRVSVALTEQCSLAVLDDAELCPRCVMHAECKNACGTCELCPGRSPEDLPALCQDSSDVPRPVCDEGQRVCTVSADCGAEHYCQLGCCLRIVQ
jgi:hypothetical protein